MILDYIVFFFFSSSFLMLYVKIVLKHNFSSFFLLNIQCSFLIDYYCVFRKIPWFVQILYFPSKIKSMIHSNLLSLSQLYQQANIVKQEIKRLLEYTNRKFRPTTQLFYLTDHDVKVSSVSWVIADTNNHCLSAVITHT